jgi:hypothetical protein
MGVIDSCFNFNPALPIAGTLETNGTLVLAGPDLTLTGTMPDSSSFVGSYISSASTYCPIPHGGSMTGSAVASVDGTWGATDPSGPVPDARLTMETKPGDKVPRLRDITFSGAGCPAAQSIDLDLPVWGTFVEISADVNFNLPSKVYSGPVRAGFHFRGMLDNATAPTKIDGWYDLYVGEPCSYCGPCRGSFQHTLAFVSQ